MFLKIGGKVLPADPEEEDGDGLPGPSQQEPPEEFTDTKHESLFSLETNFLEEESGSSCSLKASQDQNSSGASCRGCRLIHADLVIGVSS